MDRMIYSWDEREQELAAEEALAQIEEWEWRACTCPEDPAQPNNPACPVHGEPVTEEGNTDDELEW